ncbi:MAG: oxidoreductase [Candidatus Kerfeldbacteria bacterium RIFCSPLOWO2_01_FULL_48_11]|uniref:Oxidoreductase n=1 Tax=Candidatus Kerfeldbacteria bacterium RIFCSPLOWO2_01_FULL_48_11 TaxID=1798543 RepID=A0A1G2BA36_9BACT|nr:MAG: lipopolysaccharide biosynthesis protein WbpB [Parcubacteria group bacterium GW2011_GWC2_49_9]OGY85057.1 MAG: oxidoreductase [Candidatus Kerfeldbacteria bacterium RIFCSPLOWO2_01_FULL_48_11]HCJ52899.1 oxidoreductase [Candidatus Kerfeldbacteria bacterium]HCM68359.1 oxidoreductase [Candidatus Kerfeldbacteria bacterium]
MTKNFAMTGVAGYIAPRHLQAIKDTGNQLIAALDPQDSVGILDSYFGDVAFFTEFERFDRHIDKLRRENAGSEIHYLTICSPNYLHDAHIRLALRVGADAICEKPLVLNPWNLDALQELEREFGKRIYTILQLRVHPAMVALKEKLDSAPTGNKHDIDLTYITSRGKWYQISWKGKIEQSGGLATNIGIHFFDILIWLFGNVQRQEVHLSTATKTSGYIELEKARVRWYLSIDSADIPQDAQKTGKRTYRSLTMDGQEIEFSDGFTDLHTQVYKRILAGDGFGIDDARPSIQLAHDIRIAEVVHNSQLTHPLVRKL